MAVYPTEYSVYIFLINCDKIDHRHNDFFVLMQFRYLHLAKNGKMA